ncbi:MAG: hypothetical protein OXL38_00200 [Gammaproteobacteria bacterium]|nr:hypothetical protein [Gammaproteobacteria bacterium]
MSVPMPESRQAFRHPQSTFTRAALTVALAAASVAGEVFELPRSSEEARVKAEGICRAAAGCKYHSLCREPSGWVDVEADDFMPLDSVSVDGGHFTTPLIPETPDATLACALRIEGRVEDVIGVVEHRLGEDWTSRDVEREPLHRIGMIGVPYDGIAIGWGDCRPAYEDGACPDREHLPAVDCPFGEAPWHAYIGGGDRYDFVVDDLYSSGALEGETIHFRGYAAHFPPEMGGTAYWQVARGRWQAATDAEHSFENTALVYRAPQVWSDEIERITVTLQSEDGYCATTTIKFKIKDR